MKTLPADLEALMPEPAFRLAWHGNTATYRVSKPNIGGDHDCFTAAQMREAILAATERAAKICDGVATLSPFIEEAEGALDCAAAIRNAGGKNP